MVYPPPAGPDSDRVADVAATAAATAGDFAQCRQSGGHGDVAWPGRGLCRGGATLLSFVAALAVTDAERGQHGGNITSFGDGWWWAITTMTTVGYGDRYPVTTQGRFVAVGLMIGGIALLGTVTATLASWLSDRVRSETDASTEILVELHQLRALLENQNEAADQEQA